VNRARAIAVVVLLTAACREPVAVPTCDSARVWYITQREDASGRTIAVDTLGYAWFPSTHCPAGTPSGFVPK
jgi:hypothetical protein